MFTENDLKLMTYESWDSGYINKEACNKLIDVYESIAVSMVNTAIKSIQSGIATLEKILLKSEDFEVKKKILINKEKEADLYSCTELMSKCIESRNIVPILNQYVTRVMFEFKDADHHTWSEKAHDKINKKAVKKINEEIEKRNDLFKSAMENYKEKIDITSIKYENFPKNYTLVCNNDIKFYNSLLKDFIAELEDCKTILEKYDNYNLPSYCGVIKTYVSAVMQLEMTSAQKCYTLINRTLDHNMNVYKSL